MCSPSATAPYTLSVRVSAQRRSPSMAPVGALSCRRISICSADLEGFQTRLHQVLPNETHVSVESGQPVHRTVRYRRQSRRAPAGCCARPITYNPGEVVNMLTVEGTQQVMLSVRCVEMVRTTAKDLRLNVSQNTTSGHSPQIIGDERPVVNHGHCECCHGCGGCEPHDDIRSCCTVVGRGRRRSHRPL